MESDLLRKSSCLLNVVKWSNMWGSIGLLGLDCTDLEKLKRFRSYVGELKMGDMVFVVFPKEGLIKEQYYTILLMEDLSTFPIDLIIRDIFYRNYGLAGKLKITHMKKYGPADVTKSGKSKNGWKLIKLGGDSEFSDSIYKFRDTHKFQLGSSYIQIRGGNRRAPTMAEQAISQLEEARRRDRDKERASKQAYDSNNPENEHI